MRHHKRRDKKKTLISHAKRKARLRYDLEVTEYDLNQITKLIEEGQLRILERQSNQRWRVEVNYREQQLHLVYDQRRKQVITFLPPLIRTNEKDPGKERFNLV